MKATELNYVERERKTEEQRDRARAVLKASRQCTAFARIQRECERLTQFAEATERWAS